MFKSKSKKSGPLKALSSYFTSEDQPADVDKKSSTKTKGGDQGSKSHRKLHKSKDDSAVKTGHSSKDKWKANPYATIKMWRPLDMKSSVTEDDEIYQSFSNFESLREMGETMKNGKISNNQQYGASTDFGSRETETSPPASPASSDVKPQFVSGQLKRVPSKPSSPVEIYSGMNGNVTTAQSSREPSLQPEEPKRSVLDKSYSIVSEGATDSVKTVIATVYGAEEFDQAARDIEILLAEIKSSMESLRNSRIDKSDKQFQVCRLELINQTKQFINDAKLFVSSATLGREKLSVNLTTCLHTLAWIFLHTQAVMLMMVSIHQAQHVGFEVIKVSNAFKSTVSAANAAVGKPLSDPHMKYLMRQATNLASLLSSLLKMLKTLQSQ